MVTLQSVLFVLGAVLSLCGCVQTTKLKQNRPVDLVYPLLDSAHSRWFFFNSASRPFGMVNLSPDTVVDGTWGSGYRYNTTSVKGFSHIHAWQMSGVSVMPVVLDGEQKSEYLQYASAFDHAKETVEVGYHAVQLERYGIQAELTSTKRVGFHRYRFPENVSPSIAFQLSGRLGPANVEAGQITQVRGNTITGSIVNAPTRRRPKPLKIHFVAAFNADIQRIEKHRSADHQVVHFDVAHGQQLLMKVALSYTSIENAQDNLAQELDHWDFDRVVTQSKDEWNDLLSRIAIGGGTKKQQQRFYTDLWHALLGRRTISDANGAYPDNTGDAFRVGQLPLDEKGLPKFDHYNFDALWGAQWTLNTLWGLVYPDIYEDFVNSVLQYYKDGDLIPRGPSGGNYTYVMTGAPATPFVVSAYQKGIRGFDVELAYAALRKNHQPGGTMSKAGYEHLTQDGGGLSYYLDLGYVPYPVPNAKHGLHRHGGSLTLEYAYQDWTLAQFAKALGKSDDVQYFSDRSKNYRHLYDPESGWMRPKNLDGKWRTPFDPYEYIQGFIESNAAQATWFVPHDISGLAGLMGGPQAAADKLNAQFEQAEKLGFTAGTAHAMESHPEYSRIPINYGNQPSMQTAFIFNRLGRPDLTQYWSRKVSETVYSDLSPNRGYNGDEDQGLMGALAVLIKIGLFQVNGGTESNPEYEIGSPSFEDIHIQLHPQYYPGDSIRIRSYDHSASSFVVKEAKWQNRVLKNHRIRHSDIIKGGELKLYIKGMNE